MDNYYQAVEGYQKQTDAFSEAVVVYNLGGYQQLTATNDNTHSQKSYERALELCKAAAPAHAKDDGMSNNSILL